MSIRAKTQAVLNQTTEATRLVDLCCNRNGKLRATLSTRYARSSCKPCKCTNVLLLSAPMMQGIIRNLVAKVLSVHPNYIFDQQTMYLHLAPESTFRHLWPNRLVNG